MQWRYPTPYITEWQITPEQIDHYQHANNVAYVRQLELTAWAHSNHLGLHIEQYQQLDRGMVIRKHEINYLTAAHLDDIIDCATWIIACDNKLTLTRAFQFVRQKDQKTLLSAQTDFVCIALSSGKPKRMPALFANTYSHAVVEPSKK